MLLVTSSAGLLLTPGISVRQTPAAADVDALISTRLALLCSDPHVTPSLVATFCANHPRAWAMNAVAAEAASAAAAASSSGGRASSPKVVSSPSAVSALHALVSNPSFSLALFEAAVAAAAAEGRRDPSSSTHDTDGNPVGHPDGKAQQQDLPRLLCRLATVSDSLPPLGRLPLHGLATNSHALLAADVAGQARELVDAVVALNPKALLTAVREEGGSSTPMYDEEDWGSYECRGHTRCYTRCFSLNRHSLSRIG